MILEGRWGLRRTTRRQLFTGALVAISPIGIGAALPLRYMDRLYPGVRVYGLDLGGATRAEAAARIQERIAPFTAQPVTLAFEDRRWTPSAADLGISVDIDATLDRACQHGRSGIARRYATLLDPSDAAAGVPVVVEVDMATLAAYLDAINQEIRRSPRRAKLTFTDGAARIAPELAGMRIDTGVVEDAILDATATLSPTEIDVATRSIQPSVVSADLIPARDKIGELMAGPVRIAHKDEHWSVSVETLAQAMVMPDDPIQDLPYLDSVRLEDLLQPIADGVYRAPKDATVAWDGGLIATSKSRSGREVDLPALAEQVAEAAMTVERTVAMPVRAIPPAVDSSNLAALGITRLRAAGSSSFAGSSESRATNVAVAADHVSHTLIPPGGIFSFNDALGPISLDQGYVEGKIITGDWFADDLGGGVCQVSTTVYRAALLSGVPIEEWHPHSFRLGFYELDDWPPGLDAAIYQPNTPGEWELDLAFSNPTDSWMLLQMRIDADAVAADLYGDDTECHVELIGPVMGEPIAPPAPVERASADLPTGERRQIQVAQDGVRVDVTRRVRRGRELVRDATFVSDYQPQPEVWLVGE